MKNLTLGAAILASLVTATISRAGAQQTPTNPTASVKLGDGTLATGSDHCGAGDLCAVVVYGDGDRLFFYSEGAAFEQPYKAFVHRFHGNGSVVEYERLVELGGSRLTLDHGLLQMGAFVNRDGTQRFTFAAASGVAATAELPPLTLEDGAVARGSERCGDGDRCAQLDYPGGQMRVFSEGAALRQPYKVQFVQVYKDAPSVTDTYTLDNSGTTLIFDQGRVQLRITLNEDGTLRFLASPAPPPAEANAVGPGVQVTFSDGTVASGSEQCGEAERCAIVSFADGEQLRFYAMGADLNHAGYVLVERLSGGRTVFEYWRRLEGATTFTSTAT